MNTGAVLTYLLIWGLIGCAFFFIMVVVFFRTGLVFTARKPDGTLKEAIPLSGILTMLILPISYLGFQVISNYISIVLRGITMNYGHLFLLNYGVYLILLIFDTIFIDGFMLGLWRPAILKLPDKMGKESIKKHILVSIPFGLLIGVFLTLVSTTISYILWMN